jgi:flagellar biosynthetic protein FliP
MRKPVSVPWILLGPVLLLLLTQHAGAQSLGLGPGEVGLRLSMEGEGFTRVVSLFLLMTALSLAPAFVMMMTSFTRIVIVLGFLRQALGTQQSPSGRILSGLALFLTFFIMQPVWTEVYGRAVEPFAAGEISEREALVRAGVPVKEFMLRQTRENTLVLFMDMAREEPVQGPEELSMRVVVPAFMVSELQTAFQMGFLIFLPFLLIDAVASTFLMSMGMMMLPPMMISLPFKLLLFVLVDGWEMVAAGLVRSFDAV